MNKKNIKDTSGNEVNQYELVIAAAKRARQIAAESPVPTDPKADKPVKAAFKEIFEGKCRIIPGDVEEDDSNQ